MLYSMIAFFIIAFYIVFKAYRCFKKLYNDQHGGSNYQMFPGRMSNYDDERQGGRPPGAGGNSYLVSGPGVPR